MLGSERMVVPLVQEKLQISVDTGNVNKLKAPNVDGIISVKMFLLFQKIKKIVIYIRNILPNIDPASFNTLIVNAGSSQ